MGPLATAVILTESCVVGLIGELLTSSTMFVVPAPGEPDVPFCAPAACVTVKLFVPVAGFVTEPVES